MSNTVSDEDAYECSECEYKSFSEIDMVEHSIHICPSNIIESESNIISNGSTDIENYSFLNSNVSSGSSEEIKTCIWSKDVSGINDLRISDTMIKQEPILKENLSSPDKYHNGNDMRHKKIKLEHNDSVVPNSSQGQKLANLQRPRNGIEIEVNNTGIYIPPGWKRKTFMRGGQRGGNRKYDCCYFTESGVTIRSKKAALNYLVKDQSEHFDVDKLNFSIKGIDSLLKQKKPDNLLEIEVDKREPTEIDGNGSKHTAYNNMNVFSEEKIIDVSKTSSYGGKPSHNDLVLPNSSQGQKLPGSKRLCSRIEIEVDNKGIYIPPGWERKIFMRANQVEGKRNFDCSYFTELNMRIHCKKAAVDYLLKNPSVNVDVNELNFSIKGHDSLLSHRKPDSLLEIKGDNTEKYIPDGWQRKIYKYTMGIKKGKHVVSYISPLGNELTNKSHVEGYLEVLKRKGIKELIEVEKMDFSVSLHKDSKEL